MPAARQILVLQDSQCVAAHAAALCELALIAMRLRRLRRASFRLADCVDDNRSQTFFVNDVVFDDLAIALVLGMANTSAGLRANYFK